MHFFPGQAGITTDLEYATDTKIYQRRLFFVLEENLQTLHLLKRFSDTRGGRTGKNNSLISSIKQSSLSLLYAVFYVFPHLSLKIFSSNRLLSVNSLQKYT